MAGGICTASTRNSAALSNTASAAMTNRRRLLLIAAGAGTGKTKALAHRVRLSRFVIADITDPKSVPAELQTTVPQFMVRLERKGRSSSRRLRSGSRSARKGVKGPKC
jgi:hypothetical protein